MILQEVFIGIVSVFLFALLFMNPIQAYATITPTTLSEEQPKPGILIIITFENGTTKAVRSDSTNLRAVQGGYFIADSFVKASQPIQSKTVSNTVVQQLVSVFIDVSIDEPSPESPIAPEQRGGACAALYTYNPETGQCELPPAEQPPPVEPEPAPQPEPEPEPEPEPDPENEDQNDGEEGDGSSDEEGGDSGSEEGNGAEGDGGEVG